MLTNTPEVLWSEAVLHLPAEHAEAVSDFLLENGAFSVSIEDADADGPDEQPLFGEPGLEPTVHAWAASRVLALFTTRTIGDAALALLAAQLHDTAAIEWRTVAEQDWVRLTQAQFEPIEITPRLWIVPSWHEPPAGSDIVTLRLDPGLAFGTGSHPTTRLCLQWLAAADLAGRQILDYGCGSGILAIAALKLGAAGALAIDIDPQSVASTLQNAAHNHIDLHAGLPDDPAVQGGRFPVVIANILSVPLKVLAPVLAGLLAPGGQLVLSGILERQTQELVAAYAPWLTLATWRTDDGWVCLTGQRAPS
ncbi:MAG: 50S ribosomal protein L11 methyltransferase [Burkholderiaceae bacterium]|jgi:ribosomal protein L11 methyltransferase